MMYAYAMSSPDFEHGFIRIRTQFINEINSEVRWYRHAKTGAQLISVVNNDENKSFGISFATPPEDSTGIAHIMEHSVLCGSRKYPLKEPFVELSKGSLKTFLNAMTYANRTVYPVASTNLQDFYNLLDVYLDCVFYPRITPYTLQQEGWHYELDNADAQMIYKGVVFNEMKGAYSSADGIFWKRLQQTIFPDTIYSLDSGGDPKAIPDLTYEQFKRFHETYYQPANALIWFWGDDDPTRRLTILDEWLSSVPENEKWKMENGEWRTSQSLISNPQSSIPNLLEHVKVYQPKFDAPKFAEFGFDSGQDAADSKKAMTSVNWLIGRIDEADDMAWSTLGYALTGTSASPLRKALLDCGLGESVLGGFSFYLTEATFGAGLKGIVASDADKVAQIVLDTLQNVAENGLEPEMIEAALNTMEFYLREQNTGGFPRGLAAMIGGMNRWVHGEDPLEGLAYEAPLAALKTRLASGEPVFQTLIRQHLLNNPHRVQVLLKPDPTLRAAEDAAERARLDSARATMTPAQVQQVVDDTRTLKQMQAAADPPEVLALIPSLKLGDLEPKTKTIPIEEIAFGDDARCLYHELFTNGIIYLDVVFDSSAVPQADVPYLGLIGRLLLEMGTHKSSYVRLTQRIRQKTGGIWSGSLNSQVKPSAAGAASKAFESRFMLHGKATLSHLDDLLDLMREILTEAKLDDKTRFKQILLQEKAGEESGLVPGGSGVVSTRLNAPFNLADWVAEQTGGVSYLFFVRDLIAQVERDWDAVAAKLESVRKALVNRAGLLVNVTLDAANWALAQGKLRQFVAALPANDATAAQWQPELSVTAVNEGLTIPAQVNYVGKGISLADLGIAPKGWMAVVNQYVRTTWLWDRVRVQGGAYGGQLHFDWLAGTLTMVSYRDPNLQQTLEVYDAAAEFLRTHIPDPHELTRCIIGTISGLDGYQLPDAKGYSSLIRHLLNTETARQQWRDEVLGTTAEHFRAYADILDLLRQHGRVVVMGSAQAVEAANAAQGGDWLRVTKVL